MVFFVAAVVPCLSHVDTAFTQECVEVGSCIAVGVFEIFRIDVSRGRPERWRSRTFCMLLALELVGVSARGGRYDNHLIVIALLALAK